MRITKGRLKQIIKEELATGGDGEAECAELQQSFDHAYNMFQSGDYTEDQFAEISTNLKKQAEFLVTSGRVGGCPMMTSKELEMSARPISSVGGADVGFLTGALEEANLGISEEQLAQIIKEEIHNLKEDFDWRAGPALAAEGIKEAVGDVAGGCEEYISTVLRFYELHSKVSKWPKDWGFLLGTEGLNEYEALLRKLGEYSYDKDFVAGCDEMLIAKAKEKGFLK